MTPAVVLMYCVVHVVVAYYLLSSLTSLHDNDWCTCVAAAQRSSGKNVIYNIVVMPGVATATHI